MQGPQSTQGEKLIGAADGGEMFIIRPTGFLTTLSYPRRKYMIRPAQVNKYWNGKNGR
jgi:hypothetical protein